MKRLIDDIKAIQQFKSDLNGVFSVSDLKILMPSRNSETFYRRIKALENEYILKRFIKGFYVTEEFDLKTLSQRISPSSYISLDTILAEELLIGTVSRNEIKAVKIGKKREYITDYGRIIHFGISPHVYFGFYRKNGINIACKEKAFLDVLYFYTKGTRYYFDVYSDINIEQLDVNKLDKYLNQYKNTKFKQFIKGYLYEYTISG